MSVKLIPQKINNYPKELTEYFHKMSISSQYDIIGSSHYKNFIYNNDYDLNEYLKIKDTPSVLNNLYKIFLQKFIEANENPNQFITDFKCGEIKEPLRWNINTMKKGYQIIDNKKITFQECLLMNSTIKLDEVVFINGMATEITNNYFFKIGKQKLDTEIDIKKSLNEDFNKLIKEGKYFKALKRKASIYQFTHKNKLPKSLMDLFNSDDGRLYKTISDVNLIILLLALKGHKPTREQIINNLQFIKYFCSKITKFDLQFVSTDIDKICKITNNSTMIKNLEKLSNNLNKILNKDAKTVFK
jgi:hypothetical protein